MRVRVVAPLAVLLALGCGRSPLRGEKGGSTSNGGAGGFGGAPTTSITSTTDVTVTGTSVTTSVSGTSVSGTSVSGTSVSVSGTSVSVSGTSVSVSGTSVVSSSSSGMFCGDGVVDPGEECDDANVNPTDGCIACVAAVCGDGFVHTGFEACDDGNASNTDDCLSTCVKPTCGDGFVHAGVEQCDDGNTSNGDGCSSTCTLPACGDGVVEGMEQCDLGGMNEDRPALQITQGAAKEGLTPFGQPGDAALFYNYFSASSHTGLEQLNASRLFFYVDTATGILSLVVHHGIDFNTSGQHQPMSHVLMTFSSLPATTSVALSDDTPGEFQKSNATTANGNWNFNDNSDGGVLSGLPFPGSWSIGVSATFQQGISNWAALGGDGTTAPLGLSGGATLTAFATPSACRTDCTIPACGDGVLDGGETCDDGNTTSGDGCESNCLLTLGP